MLNGVLGLASVECAGSAAGTPTAPQAAAPRPRPAESRTAPGAGIDSLTGLPDRQALMQRLATWCGRADGRGASPGSAGFALLFLDVDRFGLLNDTLGHDAGDELLVQLADRLRAQPPSPTGDHCFVARFGGDEFVLLAPGVDTVDAATALARRLLADLARPYSIRQHAFGSSASIGVTFGGGPGASSLPPQDLLRQADTAVNDAKRRGRRQAVLFEATMHARLVRAVGIECALLGALARQELAVYYQPIIDLHSGELHAVEALLRWSHPTLGMVSPTEFIPIAEASGQILEIGEWVLREACQQWARWQRREPDAAPAGMSVNLSRVQLELGPRLISLVGAALEAADMPASALQLELTEREVMHDPAHARALLLELSRSGVQLAMDDFGTGSSSLGCLREYPFDTIKIDKSFITDLGRDPHVLAVAHATVDVIQNLGMSSVAEGIEDPTGLATLQAMGCHFGQGYLFGHPLPADAVLNQRALRA